MTDEIFYSCRSGDIGARDIYDALFSRYGDLNWWPAKSPYEVIVGAILTQNTAWGNVEKAIANFGGRLSPEYVLSLTDGELADIIRPSGFFNQKAGYVKSVTRWFGLYGFDVETARKRPLDALRAELLAVKGVGRETADSILLYAVGLPTFVVDAYTRRLLERLEIDAGKNYDDIKRWFESSLPRDLYLFNNFHAAIVINAKDCCRKKPLCEHCPLRRD